MPPNLSILPGVHVRFYSGSRTKLMQHSIPLKYDRLDHHAPGGSGICSFGFISIFLFLPVKLLFQGQGHLPPGGRGCLCYTGLKGSACLSCLWRGSLLPHLHWTLSATSLCVLLSSMYCWCRKWECVHSQTKQLERAVCVCVCVCV